MKPQRHNAQDRVNKRTALIKAQNNICGYCGRDMKSHAQLEHIIPVIIGGSNDDANLIAACKCCNDHKRDHVIFSLIEDRQVYPVLDIPFFFRASEIQSNGYKHNKGRA